MKRRRAVQLVALSGLSLPLAGCTDEAAQDGNETDDVNEADVDENETDADDGDADADAEDEDEENEEDEADEPDPQEFSGTGSDAIEGVELEDGLTVVDATHEGEDDFEVRLIPEAYLEDDDGESEDEEAETDEGTEDAADDQAADADDETDEDTADERDEDDDLRTLFVNSVGTYTGQTAHDLEDGTYVLSVVADGDWDVTVLQPRETSGDEPPISISGDGNEIHGPFEFDGTYEPSGEFDGERINVNVRAPTGESDDDGNDKFVFHEDSIDNPSELEYEGVGYVAVKSDGEWTVEIE